jgi:dsDNA-specific endonuclease/ATPase MutS2
MAIIDKFEIEQPAKQKDIVLIMAAIDKMTKQLDHLTVEVEKLWSELKNKR